MIFRFKTTLCAHSKELSTLLCRGVMPIQSKGARAPSDFWAKWILKKQLPKDKKTCRIMLFIFDTITLVSVYQSVKSPAAKFKSAFAGWRWARDRPVYTALNHTWLCWAHECNDQSETFRWVQGARLLTEFPDELSHQKQQSAKVCTM